MGLMGVCILLLVLFVRNAGAIVRNGYDCPLPPGLGMDFDDRASSCIFDGVEYPLHFIHNYLPSHIFPL